MRQRTNIPAAIVKYLVVILWTLVIVIPLIYVILSTFKTPTEINDPFSLPSSLYLGNYKAILTSGQNLIGLANSILIVGGATVAVVLLGSLSSYALARRKEKIFTVLYMFFLSAMMIPAMTNLTALYSIIVKLGLNNNQLALILVYIAGGAPMATLIFTGFIRGLPRELDEAAMVDGCGYFRRFFLVIFPLLKAAIVSFILLTCVAWWNDFTLPMIILSTPWRKTIILGVFAYMGHFGFEKGPANVLLLLASLPPLILFFAMQKYFYSGITMGAVKG